MMSSDSPPKTILSAITFAITLSLDRTVYLSYYSRYSRFCYFDHFFGHITGSTGPILLTSKTILSATKFPIMLGIIIFSVSVIFLEIFSKKTTPHKIPSSAQVRYYFDNNSGTTEPILMNVFFTYPQSDSLQQCLLAFFLYLSYFSKNLSDTST